MSNADPRRLELTVFGSFRASHSLTGFETPHFHLWRIEAVFGSNLPLTGDRLIDLVFLQSVLERIFLEVEGKYLNDALRVSPTSENLAGWLWNRIRAELPEAPLQEVSVELCDLDGRASGRARLGL